MRTVVGFLLVLVVLGDGLLGMVQIFRELHLPDDGDAEEHPNLTTDGRHRSHHRSG